MIITLNTHETTAAQFALGCAFDNEHDKGDDGAGEEIIQAAIAFYQQLKEGTPLEIDFHTLGLLRTYLDAYTHDDAFDEDEGDDPAAVLAACKGLIARIDAFSSREI